MRKYYLVCHWCVFAKHFSTADVTIFKMGVGKGLYSTMMILVCTSTQSPLVMSINWK